MNDPYCDAPPLVITMTARISWDTKLHLFVRCRIPSELTGPVKMCHFLVLRLHSVPIPALSASSLPYQLPRSLFHPTLPPPRLS